MHALGVLFPLDYCAVYPGNWCGSCLALFPCFLGPLSIEFSTLIVAAVFGLPRLCSIDPTTGLGGAPVICGPHMILTAGNNATDDGNAFTSVFNVAETSSHVLLGTWGQCLSSRYDRHGRKV